jgi:hypothetical protein
MHMVNNGESEKRRVALSQRWVIFAFVRADKQQAKCNQGVKGWLRSHAGSPKRKNGCA